MYGVYIQYRAYIQTYFMMDKSSGIIMVMISCRTQRHQAVEKLFRVLTMMDKSQELQTRATWYDTHANECYFYIPVCQQVHISPFITPPSPIVYIRVVQSCTYDHHHASYVAICTTYWYRFMRIDKISGIFHLSWIFYVETQKTLFSLEQEPKKRSRSVRQHNRQLPLHSRRRHWQCLDGKKMSNGWKRMIQVWLTFLSVIIQLVMSEPRPLQRLSRSILSWLNLISIVIQLVIAYLIKFKEQSR